jgi:hypothetical protein
MGRGPVDASVQLAGDLSAALSVGRHRALPHDLLSLTHDSTGSRRSATLRVSGPLWHRRQAT